MEHCKWYLHLTKGKSINAEKNENVEVRFISHTDILWSIVIYWCHGYLLVQNANCRPQNAECTPDKKCRLGTKCRLQTAEWVQNADWEFKVFFRLVCDNMSSDNLLSITQSLFRDQLSRLSALLWNIPGPFLDQNRS